MWIDIGVELESSTVAVPFMTTRRHLGRGGEHGNACYDRGLGIIGEWARCRTASAYQGGKKKGQADDRVRKEERETKRREEEENNRG